MSGSETGEGELCARFDVSRETLAKLRTYVTLLLKWQAKINIIGPSTAEQVWGRHIADSLQLTRLATQIASDRSICLLDMGTGAGLPGIPLALHLAQTHSVFVHLVDSNAKKAAFLREAVRLTGLEAEVHCNRIETVGPERVVPMPNIVLSRALAPLEKLVQWASPWIEQGATGLFLKGRSVEKEVAGTDPDRRVVYKLVPSELNPESSIVVVETSGRGHR